MNIFTKFSSLISEKEELLSSGVEPFGLSIEEVYSATEARINNQRVLLAGTNNYLGLTFAPECLAAAHIAIDQLGTGTTGSRMANGTYSSHEELERELGEFLGYSSAIIFTTGYQANLGTISGLAGKGDLLIIDADSHASIYDGCKLSGAEIIRFKHNDPIDLEKRIKRLGKQADGAMIIVEGIYSMLGDIARLNEFVEIKKLYNCYLMIDEAHSLGVLGNNGAGLIEETNTKTDIDFVTGTFSKSLGSIGGYCVSNHEELNLLRYSSRPFLFTASSSPSVIASTREALKLLSSGTGLRKKLWANVYRLYDGLKALGYELGPEHSPIIAIFFETREEVCTIWQRLLQEHGIYVNVVFPPATPGDKSLLRCSVSAAHSTEQIDRIITAFAASR
jgi:8-amino-7-oxononanoate synthase